MEELLYRLLRKRAFQILNDAGLLKYTIIKGEALSKIIYGNEWARRSSDIDFLVPKSKLGEIKEVLNNAGFKKTTDNRQYELFMLLHSHQTVPWIYTSPYFGNIIVDINFDIMWGEYEGKRINIDSFLSNTININIYDTTIRTLSPIDALVQVVLHHYKDMNSIFLLATRNSIKVEMFKDIYYLLKSNIDTISLDKLYTASAKYEIIPYVFYVLFYTGKVFEDDVLNRYIEAFRTPEGEKLINCYGLCAKERKEWRCDFITRLQSSDIYNLIKDDLTADDKEKIAINSRIF